MASCTVPAARRPRRVSACEPTGVLAFLLLTRLRSQVLHFLPPQGIHVIKDNLLPVPPLFNLIQECSGTPWREMYKVFNCGHRMEVYTRAQYAPQVIAAAKQFGIEAQIVGRVEGRPGPTTVTVSSPHGVFEYGK